MILCLLAIVSGYFLYSELQILANNELQEENNTKLLKTGSLITQLYEAERLSKLALQTKTKQNFRAYAQKVDSINMEIDSPEKAYFQSNSKKQIGQCKKSIGEKIDQ